MVESTPHSLWPSYTLDKYLQRTERAKRKGEVFKYSVAGNFFIEYCLSELAWDSLHFGFSCYRLEVVSINPEIRMEDFQDDLMQMKKRFAEFVLKNKIKFIFADINSLNYNSNTFIQSLGFKFILNWLDGFIKTNGIETESQNLKHNVISPEDVNHFAEIASKSYYQGGRFYVDSNFDRPKVHGLYSRLILNSFQEKDILIKEMEGNHPAGLFICKPVKVYEEYGSLRVAHLRFLLVDPDYRGHKIGERTFRRMLSFLKKECDIITTGIETHNIASLNLHIKMGFKFNYSHNAYHFWSQ